MTATQMTTMMPFSGSTADISTVPSNVVDNDPVGAGIANTEIGAATATVSAVPEYTTNDVSLLPGGEPELRGNGVAAKTIDDALHKRHGVSHLPVSTRSAASHHRRPL